MNHLFGHSLTNLTFQFTNFHCAYTFPLFRTYVESVTYQAWGGGAGECNAMPHIDHIISFKLCQSVHSLLDPITSSHYFNFDESVTTYNHRGKTSVIQPYHVLHPFPIERTRNTHWNTHTGRNSSS